MYGHTIYSSRKMKTKMVQLNWIEWVKVLMIRPFD